MDLRRSKRIKIKTEPNAEETKVEKNGASSQKQKNIKTEPKAKRIKVEENDAISSCSKPAIVSLNSEQPKSKRIKSEPQANQIKLEKINATSSCSNPAIASTTSDQPGSKRIKSEPQENKVKVEKIDAVASTSSDQPNVASTSTRKMKSNDKKKAKNSLAQKLIAARPYNFFLTCVTSSPETHTDPLSITFMDILHESLGELECSVQINCNVEADWLFSQYTMAGHMDKPLLIIYGKDDSVHPILSTISQTKPQVTAEKLYGSHHSKIMLFGYKDGSMRVVVSAANLVEIDWNERTQGHWISEKLEALPDGSDQEVGESATKFRKDLLKYLSSYKLKQLESWLKRIRNTNFTTVNVFLVTSIPGTHDQTWDGFHKHGHGRVGHLLSKHLASIEDRSSIIAQCSALGVYKNWLRDEFSDSFGSRDIRIIYPSFNNVANSSDGLLGGGCLHYDDDKHQKQKWLKDDLYQWRADSRNRSKAMPHIKTYCQLSDKKLFWFMLTSANLSKSAWGSTSSSRPRYRKSRYDYYDDDEDALEISNHEVGVLFMPKFVTNTSYFSIDKSDNSTPVFPLPYDIPLTKYAADDMPFMSDVVRRTFR